jgi:hypothetical protein
MGQTTGTYNQNGVYQLKCNGTLLKYVGQTGRTFKARYKEHIHAIRANRHNSKFAQHILATGHMYSSIDQTTVLHIEKAKNEIPLKDFRSTI